jgi:5-methylcytosine-specific restriction endonuclease McrA
MDAEWLDEIYTTGEEQSSSFGRFGLGYRTRQESFRSTVAGAMDTQTVVSELTENTNASDGTNATLNEIKLKLNADLCKLSLSELKDKCKDIGLSGFSSLKKTDLVHFLELEFSKMQHFLNTKSKNELRPLYKLCDIKNWQNTKKAQLICQILSYLASNLIFTIQWDENEREPTGTTPATVETVLVTSPPAKTPSPPSTPAPAPAPAPAPSPQPPLSKLEQLEKQRQELELQMQEELKRQEEEQEKARKLALEEEEAKKKNEEKERKAAAAKKKQSIPKNVRIIIWNHYIGEDIIKHKCLCCKKVTITNTSFEVGHVLSEANGGTHEINNLRPICFSCNHSMGRENMIDFVVKYGLYIG